MNEWDKAISLLPQARQKEIRGKEYRAPEEIRLRCGERPTVLESGSETAFSSEPVRRDELDRILERASGASLHAVERAYREGYISFRGLRIGVCGTAATVQGRPSGFRSVSSLAIRIPKECTGLCKSLLGQMYPIAFQNTLILSPPGGGKTTLLREVIRCLSERGDRIAVVDERNELSATEESGVGYSLGCHTDILIGVPKATASMMLLRSMNPQIIAMDEITCSEDIEAIEEIIGCGVGLLASAHARKVDELYTRPLYRKLMELKCFSYALIVTQTQGERRYRAEKLVS